MTHSASDGTAAMSSSEWSHPLKGRGQGKIAPRCNEIAVSLPNNGSFEYDAGRSLLFTFPWISGIRVGERFFTAPVTHQDQEISALADLSLPPPADQKTVGSMPRPSVLVQIGWLLTNPLVAHDMGGKESGRPDCGPGG